MRRNDKPRFIATRVGGVRISRSDRDNGALGGLVHFGFFGAGDSLPIPPFHHLPSPAVLPLKAVLGTYRRT